MEVLLISGSTRAASTNTSVLRTVAAVAPTGVAANLYDGMADLPAFNPDDDFDPLPEAVSQLRSRIASADAVLFCAPEYAGALPGSLKNLLDWTVGGMEMYGKPVAWIAAAAPGRGEGATAELATVLGYVTADIVEAACARIPIASDMVADGFVVDDNARTQIAASLSALDRHLGKN